MKKVAAIPFVLSTCLYAQDPTLFNMGYVSVNETPLSIAGCFMRADNHQPFLDFVSIFAANINGNNPNKPVLSFNPAVDQILNHSDQVNKLQKKGIKVLLSILGNHQNAGWSCMTDENAINIFADTIVNAVNKYHLDGIDIDDEYSTCVDNNTSLIRLAMAIKNHPGFKGKILSKALFADHVFFSSSWNGHKLAEFLDYGWEMTYGFTSYNVRLNPYIGYNMQKNTLGLGVSPFIGNDAVKATQYVKNNQIGGVMIFAIQENSANYLSAIAKTEFNTEVYKTKGCA